MNQNDANRNVIIELKAEILSLKKKVDNLVNCPEIRREWTPKQEAMDFLGFKDTRFSFIKKKYGIKCCKIGSQCFVNNSSLLQIFNENTDKEIQ
jgi:hypothetical protein